MKKLLVILCIAAILLSAAALADAKAVDGPEFYVYLTGNANMRVGPGLDYDKVGVAKSGAYRDFLFEIARDERGVMWYRAADGDSAGWISEKYCMLVDAEGRELIFNGDNPELLVFDDVTLYSDPSYADGYEIVNVPEDDLYWLNFTGFIHEEGEDPWYYMEYRGYLGWASGDCMELHMAY